MPEILIIILVAIGWVILKFFEGISNTSSKIESGKKFNQERQHKFGDRVLDTTKSLFDRNQDIIQKFADKVESDSYRSYYIENLTRDCLNEIGLAEGKNNVQPGHSYLSSWKSSASTEWKTLADQIEKLFETKRTELRELRQKIRKAETQLEILVAEKQNPESVRNVVKRNGSGNIFLGDIGLVLTPNPQSWSGKEADLINQTNFPTAFPIFDFAGNNKEVSSLIKKISDYNQGLENDKQIHSENSEFFKKIASGFGKSSKEDVLQRVDFIINDISLPEAFPKNWDTDFDSDESILIVEIGLPDVVHQKVLKEVALKRGTTSKPLTQKEIKENVPNIHPAILLRVAFEIFRNDESGVIKLLVINGWVEFDDPATGVKTKTYTASLVTEKDQIIGLNLSKLDPLAAFLNLKGKTAGKLIDIIPVTPTMSLNRKDKRFIATREVLNNLSGETNLAAMDWQDFESLIAELFQKEFADKGAEVKVTQASRDRGVDAVVFDPDPIKGGKYIIQAKRYTNTVDVSAVRDLCAVVKKEGASKGILVTTSSYGPDAYAFAQNEPITLLNGAELLGLLSKHNYKFRINLAEARKLNNSL